jgi:uncharacterized membrane protein
VRRRYIDVARALAILVMVEAHTFDAWTRLSERGSHAYRNLTILGGFAAPLFLWLAGIALVLSAERTAERTGGTQTAAVAVCRRGLEIFLLAFLFRLQAFIVSPGSAFVMVFRVDILNIMGPAIAAAAIVWGVARGARARTLIFAVLATATAMAAPIARTAAWVNALPLWLRWYVRPDGDYTLFTWFPWAGFVFAGAAVGVALNAARGDRAERRFQMTLAAAGAAVVALGFVTAARPTIYSHSSFWSSSPTFFAIRLGVMMMVLPVIYACEAALSRYDVRLPRLEKIGRTSLFIYWIHVELVYGYATWPLRRHLHIWQTAVAWAAFCVALYGAVLVRDRVVASWRARRRAPRGSIDALPA